MAERVLIISASVGAGHDGAARELARRLEVGGHHTEVVDFLACLPGIGGSIKRVYQFQLDHAPWSYEALYQVFFKVRPLRRPLTWLTTTLSNRRVRSLIVSFGATCVVTTYPLASLVLGRERQRGRIGVPTATFVTDFAVHPLWVHAGVDANFCVHPSAAAAAARATGRPSSAPGPLVPDRFGSSLPDRTASRAAFGIPPGVPAVLVVAGSWGVGDVEATFCDLLATGRFFPVVACGSNEELRSTLSARPEAVARNALVLGWTDRMAELVAACDVLLQNAGGLTCMEAFSAGLPVITYRPIPGHGVENALAMEAAGVAPYVRESSDLTEALERAVTLAGRSTARRARAMFAGDAADDVADLACTGPSQFPYLSRRRAAHRIARSAGAAAMLYAGFTFGADAAVAHGIDVARAPAGSRAVYVGVRLGPDTLASTRTAALLAGDDLTAVVPGPLAAGNPSGVEALEYSGVDVANGGWDRHDDVLDLMVPDSDVARAARAIAADTGSPPGDFVPPSGVNGYDLSAARFEHERIVHPTLRFAAGRTVPTVSAGEVVLVEAGTGSEASLSVSVQEVVQMATDAGLAVRPYSGLS